MYVVLTLIACGGILVTALNVIGAPFTLSTPHIGTWMNCSSDSQCRNPNDWYGDFVCCLTVPTGAPSCTQVDTTAQYKERSGGYCITPPCDGMGVNTCVWGSYVKNVNYTGWVTRDTIP